MEAFNTQLMRFFDWLLWASLQGTVLIVMIVIIQKILRRRLPVHWHYLLWLLLLIRLAVPWLPESKMSIFNLVPRFVQQGRIIESFSQSRSPDPMGFYMYARSESAPQTTKETESFSVRFVRKLPALWLVGTVLLACYVLMRSISLWRTVKRERPITDSEILDLLEDCKMQMGVETILAVVVSDKIKSPALFGFVRPRLLLPQGMLETYGLEDLRYIFMHELGHLKQRDIYLGWLMALLQVVHWFNPLMWFAFGRMRADREMACDRLAISTMGPDEPPEYGRTIVSLLESFSQVRYLPSVAGILEDTCQMERRIKMIADYKKTPRPRWAGALLLAVLACLVLTNAYVAKADFTFGEPVNLGSTVNTLYDEIGQSISADGLTLYFGESMTNPGLNGYGGPDLWVTTRDTIDDEWDPPTNLGPTVNTPYADVNPSISTDGLSLYFASNRAEGYGSWDLWMTTRETTSDPWGEPVNLGPPVNGPTGEVFPCISSDSLELYFAEWDVGREGGYGSSDLWITKRPTIDDPWSTPENLGDTVNGSDFDGNPFIAPDGLTLYFGSTRPEGYGDLDIWMTRRETTDSPWTKSVNLGPAVNSLANDGMPSLSANGSTLHFCSDRSGGSGGYDLWQVKILPVVDFNADGNIDTDDLLILIGFWGQNEPLCDIGPTPVGDGIVDIEDLVVFMSYWEKENMPENTEEEQ
jgi:beta-lactamase regulating signal transducer with metallopeptidase domain